METKTTVREIKFRAWDRSSGLWIAGFSIPQSGAQSETGSRVLMQFTGLKDKIGRDIYEGDIVGYTERNTIGNAAVVWNAKGYFELIFPSGNRNFIPNPDTHDIYGFEVIGNIYESPELLYA